VNMLSSIPAGYPAKDFYGTAITAPAAAGAIQATASGGYGFSLTQGVGGTATRTSGTPDAEGLYSGTVVVQATPSASLELVWWLVNGAKVDCGNTLTLTMDGSKTVQPVFGLSVTDGGDSGTGTLRWAVTNIPASTYNYITIGVKVPEVQLASQISTNKRINIDGNGAVIRPSASWSGANSLLNIQYDTTYGGPSITITNTHFKDAQYGAVTTSGTGAYGDFYSCIFSGNQGYTLSGNVLVYHCTFYNNNNGSNALLSRSTDRNFYMRGCLFYGNTATTLLNSYSTTGDLVSINENAVDVSIGTGTGQTGWPASSSGKFYSEGNQTLSELGVSGVPFNTSTFKPNNAALKTGYIYNLDGVPQTDFYGQPRNGTVGAVNY